MSASISPSRDLAFQLAEPGLASPFTTFQASYFVRPAVSAQPTAPAKQELISFAGAFSEMYTAAPLDLDYEELNAVVQKQEVEFVAMGESLRSLELPVINAINVRPTKQRLVLIERSAA